MAWFPRRQPAVGDVNAAPQALPLTERMENMLRTDFVAMVASIAFIDTVKTSPDGRQPRGLESYRFVPVTHFVLLDGNTSRHPADYNCSLPADINNPYRLGLETSYGIGLARRDQLLAIAAACTTDDGGLIIKQVQAGKGAHKHGLGGFPWQQSLVRAWEQVGRQAGANDLIMETSDKNVWRGSVGHPIVAARRPGEFVDRNDPECLSVGAAILSKNQDVVADAMDFEPMPDGDWRLPLQLAA